MEQIHGRFPEHNARVTIGPSNEINRRSFEIYRTDVFSSISEHSPVSLSFLQNSTITFLVSRSWIFNLRHWILLDFCRTFVQHSIVFLTYAKTTLLEPLRFCFTDSKRCCHQCRRFMENSWTELNRAAFSINRWLWVPYLLGSPLETICRISQPFLQGR